MYTVNMMSRADSIQGHGVLSAHDEQIALVREMLPDIIEVKENSRERCDITHFHTVNLRYFLSLPLVKRKSIAVGYVHFLPETVESSLRLPRFMKWVFYKYLIRFYKSMDSLVTVNPCFIDALERYGVPRIKVSYIPNYVSQERFYPLGRETKPALRGKYGLKKDKFTVLCVGQLQKRKGVLEFAQIARSMPDVQFVWAGGFSFGRVSDGYDEIRRLQQNPPPNIKFLGILDRACMNEIYNLADVMFLPSFEELFPMTILEAMCCRLPVLVRNLALYQPILSDYVLTGENNEQFIAKLNQLRADSIEYGKAAEKSAAGHVFYCREHVAQMWGDYYCGLMEHKEPCTSER